LAREKHFARAAEACHVTQPTLSAAIRQLEQELGVPLIERGGQRFRDLTKEGVRALGWAQRILADSDALEQDVGAFKNGLSGLLRFAAIPAAMAVVPLILTPFSRRYPLVTIKVLSSSSIEIQRGLDDFNVEVGLTYLENEPLRNVRMLPLYRERYMLLTPSPGPFDGRDDVTWREAAELPLCLFTPEMQNRRIVDRLFREGGAEASAKIETDSVMALCAHVRLGAWSSIVPHTFLAALGAIDGVRAIAMVEPDTSQSVGLVASDREPLPALARALLESARETDIAAQIAHFLPKGVER
jgi:DNA-binding transcriptional LysR family regulator